MEYLIFILKSFYGGRDKYLLNPNHFLNFSAVAIWYFSETLLCIYQWFLDGYPWGGLGFWRQKELLPLFSFLWCPTRPPCSLHGIFAGRFWAPRAGDRSPGRSRHSWRQRASGSHWSVQPSSWKAASQRVSPQRRVLSQLSPKETLFSPFRRPLGCLCHLKYLLKEVSGEAGL